MPDYFVPIDTTLYTDYHRNLVAKGAVIKFTMQFIEGHRKELKNKYESKLTGNTKSILTYKTGIHENKQLFMEHAGSSNLYTSRMRQ